MKIWDPKLSSNQVKNENLINFISFLSIWVFCSSQPCVQQTKNAIRPERDTRTKLCRQRLVHNAHSKEVHDDKGSDVDTVNDDVSSFDPKDLRRLLGIVEETHFGRFVKGKEAEAKTQIWRKDH